MSYLQDRKKDKRNKKIIISIVLIVIFFLFSFLGFFSKLGGTFHFLGKPFWKSSNVVSDSIDSSSYIIRNKKSVFNENKNLQSENVILKDRMINYEILERENTELKELFNRIQNPSSYILARVLSKPNKSPYDTLVIDIGKDKMLVSGEKVYVSNSLPLGEIVEIYENTALVKLYSSPDEVTEAEIDVVGASVELVGRGGGNFEMVIPKDLSVPNGVAVVLPGLNSKVLAIVVDTISEAKDPTNKIILKSPVNIQELKWVQVLR